MKILEPSFKENFSIFSLLMRIFLCSLHLLSWGSIWTDQLDLVHPSQESILRQDQVLISFRKIFQGVVVRAITYHSWQFSFQAHPAFTNLCLSLALQNTVENSEMLKKNLLSCIEGATNC